MLESLRPTTGLLAAVCLWALGLLGLSLAGLGGRFGPHPDNAALAPPLPQVRLDQTKSRLGPAIDYLEIGTRPLLSADRRPAPVIAGAGDAGNGNLDVTLTSVLITERLKLAIVRDNASGASRRVRLGETLEGSGWRLIDLHPRQAVFEGPTGQRSLDLRVFDGRSGDAPTPTTPSGDKTAGTGAVPPPLPPPPDPEATPATVAAPIASNAPKPDASGEKDQVDAIRRRIEARRAQMRADAARAAEQKVK